MTTAQVQDITERRRAEEVLRETTAMLESLIEASPVAIIAFDADAHLTRWNPAAERTFGWTAAEVLGRPNPLVEPADMEEFQAFFARAMGGESWRDLEVTRRGRDGSKIELSVSSGPMQSADGTIVGLVSLLADVTERKLAEAERERLLAALAEQNERLLELDTLKDEFVALVSHELRTPLTSIRGYLELIMDGEAGELTAEQAQFLSVIDRNSERLLRLVGDLLLVAQLEAGAMKLDLREVDLGALASESVTAATPGAEKKGIELALDVEDGTPLVLGDRSRLAQVLDNVLSNALKFTPPGGRVAVGVAVTGDGVVTEVADTGMGMTPEEQERLFQRFFRTAEATRQAIQGTGLGLTISKGIVEAHRGAISVESAKGLGTRFRIILPGLHDAREAVDNGAMDEAA
jgi:PAS domain S-box-containing protein